MGDIKLLDKLIENNVKLLDLEWKAFLYGDKDAFAYFYNLYIDDLYHYGTKIMNDEDSVKDAIQEIFFDLYLKRNTSHTNLNNFKFYLLLALKRNLIKRLRKNRRFTEETNIIDFEPEYSTELRIIDIEEREELERKVTKLINELPPKQKEAIYLRFNQALEYNEVAKILNVTVETARKQVYRALKAVKNSINSKDLILFYFLVKNTQS